MSKKKKVVALISAMPCLCAHSWVNLETSQLLKLDKNRPPLQTHPITEMKGRVFNTQF